MELPGQLGDLGVPDGAIPSKPMQEQNDRTGAFLPPGQSDGRRARLGHAAPSDPSYLPIRRLATPAGGPVRPAYAGPGSR